MGSNARWANNWPTWNVHPIRCLPSQTSTGCSLKNFLVNLIEFIQNKPFLLSFQRWHFRLQTIGHKINLKLFLLVRTNTAIRVQFHRAKAILGNRELDGGGLVQELKDKMKFLSIFGFKPYFGIPMFRWYWPPKSGNISHLLSFEPQNDWPKWQRAW